MILVVNVCMAQKVQWKCQSGKKELILFEMRDDDS